MNKQRRFILKAIGASGFFAAGYGTCYLLQPSASNNTPVSAPNSFNIDVWMPQLVLVPAFTPLSEQFPQAIKELMSDEAYRDETEQQFLDYLIHKIEQDYQNNDLIDVNLWKISRTEVLVMVAALQLGVAVVKTEDNQSVENAPVEEFLVVRSWGPKETYQGVKFNEQPDGHCGIWISAEGVNDGMEVYIAGEKSHAFINENGLTTGIYENVDEFINTVGESDIVVYDTINHRKQLIGTFQVLPAFEFYRYQDGTESSVFSVLKGWGPKTADVGEVFNQQQDNKAAFWIKINSKSTQIRLMFNGHSYQTTVRKDIVTSSFPAENIPNKPGKYPVYLISQEHDEKLHVGDFVIRPF